MRLTLDPETQQFLDEKVRGGQYTRAEDVVRAGLSVLRQQEALVDFAPTELDVLLAEGEKTGREHPSYSVDDIRTQVAARRAKKRGRRA